MSESPDEIAALMQESPVADNHGRKFPEVRLAEDGTYISHGRRPAQSLSAETNEASQALHDLGSLAVAPGDETYFGMVAHRGVLTEDEAANLDWQNVERRVEALLECTFEELATAYGAGRPDADRLARRGEIDAKLLEIQEAGGNMHQLAVVLGWPVRTTPTGVECQKMAKALARARQAVKDEDTKDEAVLAAAGMDVYGSL